MTFENQSVNFNDLLTKGYVVAKSFLNTDIMELMIADYYKKQKTFNKITLITECLTMLGCCLKKKY